MNSKYIKRQLTLSELGISIDKEIEEYYNVFKGLFREIGRKDSGTTISRWYDKNERCMFFHNSLSKTSIIVEDLYWSFVFDNKHHYYDKTVKMLISFLEYYLKIDITFLTRGHIPNPISLNEL